MTAEYRPIPYTILSRASRTPIQWLWEPYIPKGGTTMIIGDGGYGKSWMTCAIAADLSRGVALPGQEALPPQRILMISAEDGIGPVMLPRIEALGGNLENIAAYDEGFTVDKTMAGRVMAAAKEFDAAIVFLDPMVVYMGGSIDSFKANEVRSIMDNLTQISRECNIAVVGVHHVKKAFAPNAQHRSLGSVDFINGVRSAMLVDISKGGTYYMKHIKHNWSKEGPTLAYNFTENDAFHWLGEMHILPSNEEYDISHTPRGKAKAFVIATLKDGPVPSLEFIKRAKDEGFTERSVNRVKKGLAHSVERVENGVKKWYWELDEKAIPAPETSEKTPEQNIEALAGTLPTVTITDHKPDTLDVAALEYAKTVLRHNEPRS